MQKSCFYSHLLFVKLGSPPLRLGEGARMMLIEAMSQYPGDSSNPKYKRSEYADDYCKVCQGSGFLDIHAGSPN